MKGFLKEPTAQSPSDPPQLFWRPGPILYSRGGGGKMQLKIVGGTNKLIRSGRGLFRSKVGYFGKIYCIIQCKNKRG